MGTQLPRIDPFRAARIAGILGFVLGLAALPVLYYRFVIAPERLGFSRLVILVVPFLVSGLGYAAGALGSIAYNWLVGRSGGIGGGTR